MKPMSEETSALLALLASERSVLLRFGGRTTERIRLLEQVAERAEPASVLPLLDVLFDRSARVATAAADALHRILAALTPEDLGALDEWFRGQSHWGRAAGWKQLQPREVASLPTTAGSRTSVLGLASFHPSGYVREQAVRLLAGVDDDAELPFLLIRCNDWVANVRAAARAGVAQRLRGGQFEPFLRNLWLVLRLAACGRRDHTELVQAVVSRLTQPDYAAALSGILQGQHRRTARQLFRLAEAAPEARLPPLVEAALQVPDPVLRLWAARRLPASKSGQQLEETVSWLEQDRSMPVRREALGIRLGALPHTAAPALERGLLDRNPAVREFARFHWRRLGREGFACFYRNALADTSRRAAAIAGLAETGAKEDAELLVTFLAAEETKERLAAVRAIGRLAGAAYIDLLVRRLIDASPKVVRAAKQALTAHVELLDPERLWRIFTEERRLGARLALLGLLDRLGSWKGLPYLIRAASDSEEVVAHRSRQCIERRYNRVFTRPTTEERRQLEDALHDSAGFEGAAFWKGLRQWLRL